MARGGGTQAAGNANANRNNTPTNGGNRFNQLEVEERSSLDDPCNPYFLSNGDHPGLNLVSSPLIGSNYNSWSRAMSVALVAKNKIRFVDGSTTRPTLHDPYYNSWSRCISMVLSWLLHAVSKEIAESIMYLDNSADVWNDLHERFHQSNGPRIFQLKQQLNSLSQGSNDISGYFTKLKTLWEELREYRPVSACTCGGLKSIMDFQQEEYVLQFLMGLNDSYSQVRAQILMLDPLPSINKVFSLIIQEERQRGLSSYMTTSTSSSTNSHTLAFGLSTSNYNSYKGKQSKPICTHCGKLGHTINECYKLHGFPLGYKFRNNRSNPSKPIINRIGTDIENSTAAFPPSTDSL